MYDIGLEKKAEGRWCNNLDYCFHNFFSSGPPLASKSNHGSSYPCSRQYRISG